MTIGRIPSVEGGIQPTIVDAKGDLIAGVAADSINRLAVGTNGTVLTADSSTSTGLTWTGVNQMGNPIINAGMDIAQRGTSISGTSTIIYTLDRWCACSDSSGTSWTATQELTNDTTNLPTIRYAARLKRTNTGTAAIYLSQSIETNNSRAFAGKTVTLSFWARKGADYSGSSSNLIATLGNGTGTDQNGLSGFTGGSTVISQNATLTTTWQRFAFTGTISATANELVTTFYYTPTGSTFTNDYFEITGVQLDIGTYTASTAPTFRRSGGTIQGELAACQRYYTRFQAATSTAVAAIDGVAATTTVVIFNKDLPVAMRVAPTVLDVNNLGFYNFRTTTKYTGGTFVIWQAYPYAAQLRYTHGSAVFAINDAVDIVGDASAATYIGLSAEL